MSDTKQNKGRKSIDGRSFAASVDPIAAKRQQAQKKAMKIIGDAFDGERKIDDDLKARREKVDALSKEIGENKKALMDLEDDRATLREQYEVDPDSQEEKDLELLAKEVESNFEGSGIILSYEERVQIAKIKEAGLTEYQQRSLEMKAHEEPYATALADVEKERNTENAIIKGVALERLKSDPMVKAGKQADEVLEAAGREILGMLMEEGKDHIDESQEEKKEQAEKQAEKQEELQERIDAAKEKKKEQEEFTEEILEATEKLASSANQISDAQQEVKDMMSKMKLIELDIKGAAVDSEI
ncbi:MAG: hypothetical protein ACI4DO_07740 [Roseburia sp.]